MRFPTLQESFDWLKDNFFDLVTLGLALRLYFTYLQSPPKESDLPSISASILGILVLIAISGFWERNMRLRRIEKSTNNIFASVQENIIDRPSALRFFEEIPSLDTFIQNAHTIDLLGMSLTTTLNKQLSNIHDALKNDADVRIIVANPSSKSLAIRMSALRSEEPHNLAYFQKRLASTFEDIKYLKRVFATMPAKGNFNVRLLEYAPSFSIMAFDAKQSNGVIFVEIYTHVSGYRTQVAFRLTKLRDKEWYSYFENQFDDIWEYSTDWQPTGQ